MAEVPFGASRRASRELGVMFEVEMAECTRLRLGGVAVVVVAVEEEVMGFEVALVVRVAASLWERSAFARRRDSSIRRTCSGVIGTRGGPERGGGVEGRSAIIAEANAVEIMVLELV